MKNLKGEVLKNKRYSNEIFKLDVFSPYISKNASPGQFINIQCSDHGIIDPFLRRPFSIYDIEERYNVFSVLYQIKGTGTKYMSRLRPNDNIDFIGPLGNKIDMDLNSENNLFIGGGIGVAPLYFIAKKLSMINKKVFFAVGFRKDFPFPLETEMSKVSDRYYIYTEDGSYGKRGKVIDFFSCDMKDLSDYSIYCCGPLAMLMELQNIFFRSGIDGIVIMEELMACGIGVCLGCVVKVRDKENEICYKKVCTDGPAFRLSEIVF